MRDVIVNSTPVIILSKIGMLDILHKMYGDVIIPQAVFDEVTVKDDSACHTIKSLDWINVKSIASQDDRKMYKAKLHAGEVEVMILAQELGEDVLTVIDDNAARKTARYLGIKVTGTVGVLMKAKKLGYIDSVKKCIAMMRRAGFYVGTELERMALEKVGEA